MKKLSQKTIDEFIDSRPFIINGKKKYIVSRRGLYGPPEITIEDGIFYYHTLDGDKIKGNIKRITKRFIVVKFENDTIRITTTIYKNRSILSHIKDKLDG